MRKFLDLKINKKPIKLRLANHKDLKFILDLHNKNVVEKKFFSKNKILLKDHKEWFKNKIKTKMLFICVSKYKVGYIRYDHLKKNNLSISIAIKEKYKRKGFEKNMKNKIIKKKNIKRCNIFAMVKKNNLSSQKFFLNAGFVATKKNIYIKKAINA